MKKFLKLFTVMTVLLCGLSLTGCAVAEAVKESVGDSYKQWYKYKNGDKKIDIPMVNSVAEDTDDAAESSRTLKNAEIYFYFDPNAGLTVAVQSVTTQDVELMNGLLKDKVDFVVGETHIYPFDKFGKGKWAALWGSGKLEKTSAPKIYTNPEQCIQLDKENGPKIQWKKFLANYLLNKLLED